MIEDFDAAGYLAVARELRANQQIGEADAVLAEGIQRYPDQLGLQLDYCLAAQERAAWPETLERWTQLRHSFSGDLRGYVGAATALQKLQRFDEAEALLGDALGRFSDHPTPFIHYAMVAQDRGNPTEAVQRWATLRQRFPGEMLSYVHAAVALQQLSRLDEAEDLLREAVERFPERREPLAYYAGNAQRRGDLPESALRWDRVHTQFPDDPLGYLGASAVLRQLGQFDDAEVVIAEAVERFPANRQVLQDAANLATLRSDWPLALMRWQEFRMRYPGVPGVEDRIQDAQARLPEQPASEPVAGEVVAELELMTASMAEIEPVYATHELEPAVATKYVAHQEYVAHHKSDSATAAHAAEPTVASPGAEEHVAPPPPVMEEPVVTVPVMASTPHQVPQQDTRGKVGRTLKELSSRMQRFGLGLSRR